MKKIIYTRPDFDGIVCAVLLLDAENTDRKIKWTEPYEIQHKEIKIIKGSIIANLPYDNNCSLWFDHHQSNIVEDDFKGAFKIAPSAAGLIYDYYKKKGHKFKRDYERLVSETDRIDSAQLTKDEILNPEKYSYIALSMVVSSLEKDEEFWNKTVRLLGEKFIDDVIEDEEIKDEINKLKLRNSEYKRILIENTKEIKGVTITDLRNFKIPPNGNRFLVFSLFPDSNVNVKIRYNEDRTKVIISVGHSIFNRTCNVNSGILVSRHGGGGHFGAGSCNFPAEEMSERIDDIVQTLIENKKEY